MSAAQNPYQILGEEGIRQLTETFYDIMDTLPEAAEVRAMHVADLSGMKLKLAEYLTGWMGGPPIYSDKYGSVCMTSPHEHYHIGPRERDQWLLCMDKALEKTEASDELLEMLKVPMFRIADAIRNRDDVSAASLDDNIIAAG
ncbi:MAG: group II truncated hemoglobin [Halioglobus sp.]